MTTGAGEGEGKEEGEGVARRQATVLWRRRGHPVSATSQVRPGSGAHWVRDGSIGRRRARPEDDARGYVLEEIA